MNVKENLTKPMLKLVEEALFGRDKAQLESTHTVSPSITLEIKPRHKFVRVGQNPSSSGKI